MSGKYLTTRDKWSLMFFVIALIIALLMGSFNLIMLIVIIGAINIAAMVVCNHFKNKEK